MYGEKQRAFLCREWQKKDKEISEFKDGKIKNMSLKKPASAIETSNNITFLKYK